MNNSELPPVPEPAAIEAAAQLLAGNADYRILRRLPDPGLMTLASTGDLKTRVGVVIDVETEGLDSTSDRIIELAARRFRFDSRGEIVQIGQSWVWREDPGRPLSAEITRLTGLTDADLAGQSIDDEAATALLQSSQVLVAHNAPFDVSFVEQRLPGAAGLAWACSMRDVDWAKLGFDGRSLTQLVEHTGYFFDAHSAENDINALLHLLSFHLDGGSTILAKLMENAERPTLKLEAVGAPFEAKDSLKARGYRWDVSARVWWTEIPLSEEIDEQLWLQRNNCRCTARLTQVTWKTRHRPM
jgi:DNA polymerase-3 subunit epsilon